jgi:hypothetical protein
MRSILCRICIRNLPTFKVLVKTSSDSVKNLLMDFFEVLNTGGLYFFTNSILALSDGVESDQIKDRKLTIKMEELIIFYLYT